MQFEGEHLCLERDQDHSLLWLAPVLLAVNRPTRFRILPSNAVILLQITLEMEGLRNISSEHCQSPFPWSNTTTEQFQKDWQRFAHQKRNALPTTPRCDQAKELQESFCSNPLLMKSQGCFCAIDVVLSLELWLRYQLLLPFEHCH